MSLPTRPAGAGEAHRGVLAVVDADVLVDDDELVVLVEELWDAAAAGASDLELSWACAYAAIPPEIRTSIAAAVRIWSLPVSTCMNYRAYLFAMRYNQPHPGIWNDLE